MNIKKIVKIAVIEKRNDWRQKLTAFIELIPGLLCTGNYAAVSEATAAFAKKLPDIVLCNFAPTDGNEKNVVEILRKKYRALPILILNLYDETDLPKTLISQSHGCLVKLTFPAKLLQTTRFASAENLPLANAAAVAGLFYSSGNYSSPEIGDCKLTPHEIRLLKLLIDGHNHTTSTKILNVSYNTVKFHMRRIYQKLEVNSKSAAVAKAMRYRLTE